MMGIRMPEICWDRSLIINIGLVASCLFLSLHPTLGCRLRLKCDGTRAETRIRLSAKRTSPFKSAGASVQSNTGSRCASAVVMLDTPCSEVVWRVLATHSIRQFPLHFPSRASPCAIIFQLESTPEIDYKDEMRIPRSTGVPRGGSPPPPEIPKAQQNRANPIVKTVNNCWI